MFENVTAASSSTTLRQQGPLKQWYPTTVSQHTRLWLESSPPWKPQISHQYEVRLKTILFPSMQYLILMLHL